MVGSKKLSVFLNFILLSSIILDPTNTILHIKDIVFVLFILVSFSFVDCKYYFVPVTLLTVFFISFSFGILTSQDIDFAMTVGILKSFIFLLYMFWVPCGYLNVFKSFYHISLAMAVLEIAIYFLISFFPIVEAGIYLFMRNHGDTVGLASRNFYGIKYFMVFYKTSPILVITLCFSLVNFYKQRSFKYITHTLVFVVALFISGTRANMFSCVLLVLITFILYKFYCKKNLFFTASSLCIFILLAFGTTVFLLTAQESSTEIKTGHLNSFFLLFGESPVKYALVGAGPGAKMYSSGFGEVVSLTELTYLELIKNFGFVQTVLIIVLFLLPLLNYFNNKNYDNFSKISLTFGYIAYLFIAGTNPLLIGSTGFTVVAIVFYMSIGNVFLETDSCSVKVKNKKFLSFVFKYRTPFYLKRTSM